MKGLKSFLVFTRGRESFGDTWQWDKPRCLLAVKRRPRYGPWKKCQVSRSLYPRRQIINGQEPSSRHPLMLPPPAIFTEVRKVPFSSYSWRAGLVYFSSVCRRLERAAHIQRHTKKRRTDRDIFCSPLWVFFVEWKGNLETLCNVASKVLKGLWERFFFLFFFLPVKSASVGPLEERVSMLHPYRMESYLIPPVSILFCLFSSFSHFTSVEAVQPFSISLVFVADFQQENACEWGPTAGVFHPTPS